MFCLVGWISSARCSRYFLEEDGLLREFQEGLKIGILHIAAAAVVSKSKFLTKVNWFLNMVFKPSSEPFIDSGDVLQPLLELSMRHYRPSTSQCQFMGGRSSALGPQLFFYRLFCLRLSFRMTRQTECSYMFATQGCTCQLAP